MLRRIYADNYRCLVNFEFAPQQVNLLVGDNGSGKTAVFDVLEALQDIVVRGHAVDEVLPTTTLTRWDTRDVQRFELEFVAEAGTYTYTLEVEHDRKSEAAVIRRESVVFGKLTLFRFEGREVHLYDDAGKPGASFPADPRRSFLAVLDERAENQRLTRFTAFVQGLWILRINPLGIAAVSRKETQWVERDGRNLVSWYRDAATAEPQAIDALRADLQATIGGLQVLRLVSTGGRAKEFVASMASNAGSARQAYELSFDELSTGQRMLFALYMVLHLVVPQASVVCIDEPDNFVALREIQPWLIKMSDAIEARGSQLMIISHHPEVIDYLAAASPHKFERPGDDVVRVRPLRVDLDSGLKASEALTRGWDDGEG